MEIGRQLIVKGVQFSALFLIFILNLLFFSLMSKQNDPFYFDGPFSFPKLIQEHDAKRALLETDKTLFLTKGNWTQAMIDNSDAKRTAFDNIPGDDYYLNAQTTATDQREAARLAVVQAMTLINMSLINNAKNPAIQVSLYTKKPFSQLTAEQVYYRASTFVKRATADTQPAALEAIGILPATIANIKALNTDLDKAINYKITATDERRMATERRNLAAAELFEEIRKISRTGKELFRHTSQARYNLYRIYNNLVFETDNEEEIDPDPALPTA